MPAEPALWCGPRLVPLINHHDPEGQSSVWRRVGHVLVAPGYRIPADVFRAAIAVPDAANQRGAA